MIEMRNFMTKTVVIYDKNECDPIWGKPYAFRLGKNARPIAEFVREGSSRADSYLDYQHPMSEYRGNYCKIISPDKPLQIYKKRYTELVRLPDPVPNMGRIVSQLVAETAKSVGRSTDDLYIPLGVVYDDDGYEVGHIGFYQL